MLTYSEAELEQEIQITHIKTSLLGVVAQAFKRSTWEEEAGRFCEFEACLIYIASSRPVRAT